MNASHDEIMRKEQARQIRAHLMRYGDQMTEAERAKHEQRLAELERRVAC